MTSLNQLYTNEEKMAATLAMLHDEIRILSKLLIGTIAPTKPNNNAKEVDAKHFMAAMSQRQSKSISEIISCVDDIRFLRDELEGDNNTTTSVVEKDDIDIDFDTPEAGVK